MPTAQHTSFDHDFNAIIEEIDAALRRTVYMIGALLMPVFGSVLYVLGAA